MQNFEGESRPAQMPVAIEDQRAMIGQYIRHIDSEEIFKITEVGREGVTAYHAEGFGGPVSLMSAQFMITWASLKYKHRFMVHAATVDVKPEHMQ